MRVPLAKIFRAFPELDRFTDEECRRLLLQARHHARVTPRAGCIGVACLVILVGGVGGSILSAWAISRFLHTEDDMVGSVIFCGSMVLGVYAGIRFRDRHTRAILRRQVERTTCPTCGGSLLGGRRSADHVRCGSCGGVHAFTGLGIDPTDLGPALITLAAETRCTGCSYVIGGLPVRRGKVTCPECGRATAIATTGTPEQFGDEELQGRKCGEMGR